MKVIYSDRVKEAGKDMELLRQATDYLEKSVISARSAPRVTIEWDLAKDNGRILYTLRISDWAGSAEADFSREELATLKSDLRYRLKWVWGEVLEKRSDIEIKKLLATGPES